MSPSVNSSTPLGSLLGDKYQDLLKLLDERNLEIKQLKTQLAYFQHENSRLQQANASEAGASKLQSQYLALKENTTVIFSLLKLPNLVAPTVVSIDAFVAGLRRILTRANGNKC